MGKATVEDVQRVVLDQSFLPANIRGVRRAKAAPSAPKRPRLAGNDAPVEIHAAAAPAPAPKGKTGDAAFDAFMSEMSGL